uniref:Alpha-latroinsectotoxin-Lt1a-like n=1 Tax=Diabrotica virgifera virgifera TaxID=50390 RepID=A0A6P7GM21_DIAVI
MDINVSTNIGNLPAHVAALSNKVEILRYLKSVGSDINQCNSQGRSLVHLAAEGDAVDVLNFLKDECNFSLNLDLPDNDGFTPSHCADYHNALKAIRFLKEQGANLSISKRNKRTPVHETAQRGALEVLQYIVEDCKMDINVSTNIGNLPAHLFVGLSKIYKDLVDIYVVLPDFS